MTVTHAVSPASGGLEVRSEVGVGSQPAELSVAVALEARERASGVEDAMRAYLAWEIELVNQMAVDEDQRFSLRPAPRHPA